MSKKKYILKPGRHQFAPGSVAIHENETLTYNKAAWHLKGQITTQNQSEERI